MKIYIMTDMEGVAGNLDFEHWCGAPDRGYSGMYYEQGKEFLTREVNAAIDGFFAGGASEIVVSDGHGCGGINPALLDPRARLLRGWPNGWPSELDASYDAVAVVGQHPKAGTVGGHICHTQSWHYIDQTINGVSVGEFGQFVLCASELGVPAIFASGDEAFRQEAEALVPGTVAVAVKQGVRRGDDGRDLDANAYSRYNLGAIHLHPEVARQRIREGALAAMQKFVAARGTYGIVPLKPPYERVTLMRPWERCPSGKSIDRATHPTSVAGVLNMPFKPQQL